MNDQFRNNLLANLIAQNLRPEIQRGQRGQALPDLRSRDTSGVTRRSSIFSCPVMQILFGMGFNIEAIYFMTVIRHLVKNQRGI